MSDFPVDRYKDSPWYIKNPHPVKPPPNMPPPAESVEVCELRKQIGKAQAEMERLENECRHRDRWIKDCEMLNRRLTGYIQYMHQGVQYKDVLKDSVWRPIAALDTFATGDRGWDYALFLCKKTVGPGKPYMLYAGSVGLATRREISGSENVWVMVAWMPMPSVDEVMLNHLHPLVIE